uniref:Uncharacterized protein n=1 Tax=Oryza rufipogon TaxID=4529 RepID=A0A0E0N1D9_ORYRU
MEQQTNLIDRLVVQPGRSAPGATRAAKPHRRPLLSHASPPPEQPPAKPGGSKEVAKTAAAGLPFLLIPGQVVGAPMRPEHEGRSSARTARSGAVEFGSGPPFAGSGLDAQVGGEGGSRGGDGGARAAQRRRRRRRPQREGRTEEEAVAAVARGPRGGDCGARTSRQRWLRLADVHQLLLLWLVCTRKWLAAATSLIPGGLKNPSRGAPPLLWPDPVLAVGSFRRGWTRRLVQRTTVPWRRAGAGREPT